MISCLNKGARAIFVIILGYRQTHSLHNKLRWRTDNLVGKLKQFHVLIDHLGSLLVYMTKGMTQSTQIIYEY